MFSHIFSFLNSFIQLILLKGNTLKSMKFILPALLFILTSSCNSATSNKTDNTDSTGIKTEVQKPEKSNFDTALYLMQLKHISNGDTTGRWPVSVHYPLPGALFPAHRIVAYYGNLYSKKMGILGELPKEEMLKKLMGEVESWQKADTVLKVIPALHYVAVTAQAGGDKKRMRMPSHQIDTILSWAKEINALTFVDIQVGWSTLEEEIPQLEKYLSRPDVHLGIDPEFSMKFGDVPGKRIGTFDAKDINYAINYLASIVKKYNLPPKILVVHRFTQGMVTNYKDIKIVPEVQVVMDMDGWGNKTLKRSTWLRYIFKEPVEFTGFKIFYKNDLKNDPKIIYTPEELIKFIPQPVYIQYQ